MKMKRIGVCMLCICILLSISMIYLEEAQIVSAGANYTSYTYDEWDESCAAPSGYSAKKSRIGEEWGIGMLKEPQDIFAGKDGTIYIADTGNNRVVLADEDLNLVDVIDSVLFNGEEVELTDPQGLHVTEDGLVYVAQTSLSRILILDGRTVIDTIEKPVHSLISEDFFFQPTRMTVDQYGRLYVLSKGCYSGLLRFNQDGTFMEFYGANKVEVTATVVFQYMWKNLLTDDQRDAMTSILPIEYSSVMAHSDGFIYTTTVGNETSYHQIKRLNPLGENTYFQTGNRPVNFGDEEVKKVKGAPVQVSFVDVCVDEAGFIFGLDRTNGRVFVRDLSGNLIAVFGGIGRQLGTFQTVTAIDVYEERVYVLDSLKGCVTMFEPTEYGKLVREATIKYNEGDYEASESIWQEVSRRNGNSIVAYVGQGKAKMQENDYKEAMDYLQSGGERYTYSRAFSKYRLDVIKRYGSYCIVLIVVLILVMKITKKVRRKSKPFKADDNIDGAIQSDSSSLKEKISRFGVRIHRKNSDAALPSKTSASAKADRGQKKKNADSPWYTVMHPFDASYDIRFKDKGKIVIAVVLILVWFFASIFERQNTGYIFNSNKLSELNIFLQLAKVMIPFFMWVCGNYIVSILMNGTARLKDIFIFSAYSLLPHILGMVVGVLLSNVLARGEPFGMYISVFGTAWSAIVLFIGMMVMHEYKFKENIAACLFSVGVMAIILFLAMLVGNLYTEFSSFIKTVVQEIIFRI